MKQQKQKYTKSSRYKINLTFKRPKDEEGKRSFAALFKAIALTLQTVKYKLGIGRNYAYSYRYFDPPTNLWFIRPIKTTNLHLIDTEKKTHTIIHNNVPFVKQFKEEIANYLFPKRYDPEITDQKKREEYDIVFAAKDTKIDRRRPHIIKYFKGKEPKITKKNVIMSLIKDYNQT
jgi:hypothetical protein